MMGVSKQFVRIGLQRGTLPIGSAVKMTRNWSYYISPKLMEEFTGMKKDSPAATDESRESATA